ncbi:MAG: hypothetical protein ABI579_06505, partial [Candidatus Sumerlaeota bacterium]
MTDRFAAPRNKSHPIDFIETGGENLRRFLFSLVMEPTTLFLLMEDKAEQCLSVQPHGASD